MLIKDKEGFFGFLALTWFGKFGAKFYSFENQYDGPRPYLNGVYDRNQKEIKLSTRAFTSESIQIIKKKTLFQSQTRKAPFVKP